MPYGSVQFIKIMFGRSGRIFWRVLSFGMQLERLLRIYLQSLGMNDHNDAFRTRWEGIFYPYDGLTLVIDNLIYLHGLRSLEWLPILGFRLYYPLYRYFYGLRPVLWMDHQ